MNKIASRSAVALMPIVFAGIITAQTAANWTRQIPSNFPTAGVSLMAYDSAHGQVVLYQIDTWTWDGSNWTKKSPANSPPLRGAPAMAYDSAHGQVVLFGGNVASKDLLGGIDLSDTWVWDGSNWMQKSPATSPPARHYHTMAYDSAHSQVVLFGGYNGSTPLNDTWVWDGSTWVQKSPQASPPARFGHAMAYDSAHNQTVVFGGWGTSTVVFNDTWTWDGTNWTKKSPQNSPPARFFSAMAYDSAHTQVVMFGGENFAPPYFNDTWTWDGSNWTQKSPPNSPSARELHSMAYDSAHGQVVLFGGTTSFSTVLGDTWTWNGGALTPQINTGGIVNNASYTLGSAGSSVAPGSIAAVFGSNLTDGSSCLPPTCNPSFGNNGKLNTSMAGAQVTVGGTAVPIFYATPTQLGIQIPFELAGTSAAVVVSVAGQSSVSSIVTVASVSPGIFTYTADGKGPGAITHVNGSAVTAQSPAQAGEIVILYATGLGQVMPAVATGALPAGASTTISPVMLNIGGIGVIPDYAGLSGCCVGLNQINARVPAGVTLGTAVPVVLNISGQSSNTATIAVQ